ncbi:phytoene desaturase family protein [Montanilutibacter psychrotolerans]|uniref:NAD(P)/FAD-dependent oxidoreductase n=1 Tax=Montanilutibacter psychrotolerans TaxID=1327343 RepID=A0A3M8SYZ4_9GAMM|nr:NAD(P)/FAD-dependent oxidoreductase [Lysobacter psychrotolerans]RNF84474.1 NAD(P)/FAD-dependent oxidoreductase [Lysobacter psychrotolerans]
MSSSDKSSVVVIGAGLAGLSAALSLARSGRQVTVLEASDAVGGCCSTRKVSGYTFNNGALYVAVPSALKAAFHRLGLDFDAEVSLAAIANPHRTVLDNGTTVHLSSVEASFVEGVDARQRTATLRRELATLRNRWSPIYQALVQDILPAPPSLPRVLGRLWRHLPRMGGSVERLISTQFQDPDVRAAVASTLLYTGTAPARLPATQIIGFMALLEEGFHLPHGGMGMIPAALERAAEKHSISIRRGVRANKLEVSNGRVCAVELSTGERIESRQVVATCSGFELAAHLLPEEAVPARLVRQTRRSPLSHRAIAIQIGCQGIGDPGAFIVNHVPPMPEQGRMHVSETGVPRWLAYTNPTRTLPELAPEGKAVIEFYAPVSGIALASQWTEAMTERTVTSYVDGLRKKLPTLSIETVEVMDPQTFVTQRHLHEGALYGVAPGATPGQFFPHRTPVKGLYLAGQTTFPGYGVPSAMWSGIQVSDALLADAKKPDAQ